MYVRNGIVPYVLKNKEKLIVLFLPSTVNKLYLVLYSIEEYFLKFLKKEKLKRTEINNATGCIILVIILRYRYLLSYGKFFLIFRKRLSS